MSLEQLFSLVEKNNTAELQQTLKSYEGSLDAMFGEKPVTLLHLCALKNRPKCADILLEAQANPDVIDESQVTPLHFAASVGNIETMEILIDHGAGLSKVDALKRTPFECAVRYNRMEAVKILLENHVNVNVKNRHGVTALHLASESGNLDLLLLLLKFRADVNAVTESRRTPLHFAAQKGHTKILKVLLEHGADVNSTETKLRETPLHRAASGGTSETIEILLKHKADLHALNQNRRTPLHKASMAGNAETITCLLSHGSAVSLKDKNGKTAIERAANSTSRAAFDRVSRKNVKDNERKKKIARDSTSTNTPLAEMERENQKDILHLKSVFQAITKASEDTERVITAISKRHGEIVYREKNNDGDTKKLKEMREKVETELKNLHLVLSEISQSINTSQDAMECCIFATDPNLDSTYDSTADWELDTLDDDVDSFDSKIEHFTLSNISDEDSVEQDKDEDDKDEELEDDIELKIEEKEKKIEKIEKIEEKEEKMEEKILERESNRKKPKRMKSVPNDKKQKVDSKLVDSDGKRKGKKKIKRAKSVKKLSNRKLIDRRQSTDNLHLKDELSQMDKDELLELALKLKDDPKNDKELFTSSPEVGFKDLKTKASNVSSKDPPEGTPESRGGMSKQLKHRIPSKTRLRIDPLAYSEG